MTACNRLHSILHPESRLNHSNKNSSNQKARRLNLDTCLQSHEVSLHLSMRVVLCWPNISLALLTHLGALRKSTLLILGLRLEVFSLSLSFLSLPVQHALNRHRMSFLPRRDRTRQDQSQELVQNSICRFHLKLQMESRLLMIRPCHLVEPQRIQHEILIILSSRHRPQAQVLYFLLAQQGLQTPSHDRRHQHHRTETHITTTAIPSRHLSQPCRVAT